MRTLRVRHIGKYEYNIKFNRCRTARDRLLQAGVYDSDRDLAIMLYILGNRHLANLAHYSPEKNKTQKSFKVTTNKCS